MLIWIHSTYLANFEFNEAQKWGQILKKIAKSYAHMLLHELHIHQWKISIFEPDFNLFNQRIQLQIAYNMDMDNT
jgi:hypothetical protein